MANDLDVILDRETAVNSVFLVRRRKPCGGVSLCVEIGSLVDVAARRDPYPVLSVERLEANVILFSDTGLHVLVMDDPFI